ncbi:serine hydrolase [Hymenobacter sp. RP-2-7]|uniref:Serine hydrolase n=1 Tax=Hymenobacter polaris TaxID=2682546 RepID=A0A7Y0AAF4_9BACT|nr:serine hydrolase [Hymenobacter polaris]NML63727.1 serine hydrolase [Hymenobacter polaris]
MAQLRRTVGLALAIAWQGLAGPAASAAQMSSSSQIDSLVGRAMRTFDVPGLGLAIVQNGHVVLAQGYGVRVAGTRQAVDAHTLFAIASNSKAFTAAALGILVDEGKLRWDDKVIDHLPEFRMYDPWVTADCTVRDLLTHRSGLAPQAGDLMRWPDSAAFTIPDVIHNLRYLKPVAPFRSRYAYDNILYLVAGELVARVSGLSWDDFIEQRILAPLQMRASRAAYARINLKKNPNVVQGHYEVGGHPQAIATSTAELDAGAGGIYSSAADMSRWTLAQLAAGQYGAGQRLFSAAVAQEMWTPQIPIPASPNGVYHTHFGAYGLGWFLVDEGGYQVVSHTGQDEGQLSEITLLPELGVGIVVLTNQEGGGAVRAVTDQLVDGYLGLRGTNRVQYWADRVKARSQASDTVAAAVWHEVARHPAPLANAQVYVGTYRDSWLGEVTISQRGAGLWFQAAKSPQLRGPLQPYRGNTFAMRWVNPLLRADALVVFALDAQGQAKAMTMQTISPASTFQGLDFQRVSR